MENHNILLKKFMPAEDRSSTCVNFKEKKKLLLRKTSELLQCHSAEF